MQAAVRVERKRRAGVDGPCGLGVVDEAGDEAHERAHLCRGGRGGAERVHVAAEDCRVPAGTVGRSWGPHTAGYGVAERRQVEGGAQVLGEAGEGGDGLGVDGLGQGDPQVPASGRPGLAEHVGQADVAEEAAEHVGVASCGRGVTVRVEVERQEPEPAIGAGQVDGPRALRRGLADRAIAVVVQDGAVGVDDGDAHTRARAHRHGQSPRLGVRVLGFCKGKGYDGTTFQPPLMGTTKPRFPTGSCRNCLDLPRRQTQKIRHLASAPRLVEAGGSLVMRPE